MRTHLGSTLMYYLDEVAREGSIRRAAERINISPSAINRQIINFEEQIGMPLFERQARGMKLTVAGKVIVETIRRFNRDVSESMLRLDDLRGLRSGHVTFGSLLSLADELVPIILAHLRSEYPNVSYFHFAGNSGDVMRHVVDGSLEIGMSWDPPNSAPVMRAATYAMPIGVLVPPGHELTSKKSVALMDCLHLPVILPAKGSEVRHMIDRINTGIGATITPATETNSIYLAKRLAVDGHGIALLPALSAAVEIKAKSLVHIPLSDPGLGDLRFTVFTQRGRPLTAIAEMVLERMRDDVENYLSAL